MGPGEEVPGGSLTDCNFTSRGDKSLAYDLVARSGRVSGRVALLLRSAERQPEFLPPRFFFSERESIPRLSPINRSDPYTGAVEGGIPSLCFKGHFPGSAPEMNMLEGSNLKF